MYATYTANLSAGLTVATINTTMSDRSGFTGTMPSATPLTSRSLATPLSPTPRYRHPATASSITASPGIPGNARLLHLT